MARMWPNASKNPGLKDAPTFVSDETLDIAGEFLRERLTRLEGLFAPFVQGERETLLRWKVLANNG